MKQFCTLLMLVIGLESFSQPIDFNFNRTDSIPVTLTINPISYAWAGGLNYAQFSNIDLNDDGIEDLFVFDRTGNKVLTFIHQGGINSIQYKHEPSYEIFFPDLTNWALLVDYNCDNKPDIFTNTPGGIRIYKNTSTTGNISFQMVKSLLYSYYYTNMVNLYVSSVDVPAITDIDGDGDIDVLTFSILGSRLEYHKNLSVENGFGCDSLLFRLKNECWGNFSESILNNTLALFDTCSTTITGPELTEPMHPSLFPERPLDYIFIDDNGERHSGSCILAFDNDGVNSKDLLIGDISAKSLVLGVNGGSSPNLASSIISQDTAFPSYDIPIQIKTMPCPFLADVNNDGNLDLIATPQSTAVSENAKGVYYYQNLASSTNPDFNLQLPSFLQGEMIERGEGALPVIFDYDGDGLLDLFISNYGFFNAATDTYVSKLALFKNTGTSTNPQFMLQDDNFENLSVVMNDFSLHPAFGDLDGDGDKDMIVGAYTGNLYYFENIAALGNPADYVLSQANIVDNSSSIIDVGQYSTPFLVDLDRDNDQDLIIGERNGNLNYYENIGTSSNFNFRFRSDTLGGISVNQAGYVTGYSVPSVYDVGGKYQLIIGSQTGYIHHYDSIDNNILGNYRMVDTMLLGKPDGIRTGVAPCDINNDGQMDLFTGNYRGGVSFYKGDVNGTIGISRNELIEVYIYPNPAEDDITIMTSDNQFKRIKIYDLTGKCVFTSTMNQTLKINLNNFTTGIYLMDISTSENRITKKIIKK